MITRPKFYEMQNFVITLLMAGNLKLEQTITIAVNFMNYNETDDVKVALIQLIPLQRFRKELKKDVLGFINDRFLNFVCTAEEDEEHRTITIWVTKKA